MRQLYQLDCYFDVVEGMLLCVQCEEPAVAATAMRTIRALADAGRFQVLVITECPRCIPALVRFTTHGACHYPRQPALRRSTGAPVAKGPYVRASSEGSPRAREGSVLVVKGARVTATLTRRVRCQRPARPCRTEPLRVCRRHWGGC